MAIAGGAIPLSAGNFLRANPPAIYRKHLMAIGSILVFTSGIGSAR